MMVEQLPKMNAPITVLEWADRWLDGNGSMATPQTIRSRRNFIRDRLLPVIGDKLLTEVLPNDITFVLRESALRGSRVSTQRQQFNLMNAIFRDARQARFITENPCARVRPARLEEPVRLTWSMQTLSLQIDALRKSKMKDVAMLAMGSALRPVELYNGRVEDYESSGPWLNVTYRSRYVIVPRRIALPRFAGDALEALIASGRQKHSPFIVSNENRRPYDAESFGRMCCESLESSGNAPARTYGDLRRAFNFLAAIAGVEQSVIAHYLKMRTHVPPPSDDRLLGAVAKIDDVFKQLQERP
jgi:integrase